ncbi:MAG: hypothetical protein J5588_04710, partial [Bacteroidales bacterium]|nr:hypothetical protein [Bacteroidales bacterium]
IGHNPSLIESYSLNFIQRTQKKTENRNVAIEKILRGCTHRFYQQHHGICRDAILCRLTFIKKISE